jgi:hypothetical protein
MPAAFISHFTSKSGSVLLLLDFKAMISNGIAMQPIQGIYRHDFLPAKKD